jgi:3-oxoadipate enol-lactonase
MADEARIYYRSDGPASAPALVLAHALGTQHEMWARQRALFARHFRVVSYDLRGHGASEVRRGPYDMALLGRDLLRLLDMLGLARVNFLGLSLGGMIGTWFAAHAPERVQRLVLCNTSALMPGAEAWNARIETARREGMAALVGPTLERWFTPRFHAADPAAVDRIRTMLLATPPTGYAACCAAVRDMDHRRLLARIAAPTLVIAGTHDPSTPVAHAQVIAHEVPGARLVELNAAHLSNVEAAEPFNAAVLDFLAPEARA